MIFLNAEMIGRFDVCVLGFLNAHMFACSNNHMLVCPHNQILVYSHASMFTYKLNVTPSYDLFFNYMCTHLNDNIPLCLKIETLMLLVAQALTCFDYHT